jgi:hypothetical protein
MVRGLAPKEACKDAEGVRRLFRSARWEIRPFWIAIMRNPRRRKRRVCAI